VSLPRTPRAAVLGLTVGALAAGGLAVAAPAVAAPGDARITEIHYDDDDADAGEAVEVTAPAAGDLTGLSLVLYNGNGGASYGTLDVPASSTGVAVVPAPGLQNGSPDGIALIGPTGVLEFISYEGTFTATAGPASGMTSTDIGVSEAGAEPEGQSLQRIAGSADPGAWTGPSAATFGARNATGTPVEPPPTPVEPPPTTGGTPATTDARFTEIHYDDEGADTAEAIEVTAASAADLAGLSVVLYNGSSNQVYDTDAVVADGDGIAVVSYPPDGIQNGAPDAFALVASDGRVLEFLSYEGVLTAANGPAAGTTSTDIGVVENAVAEGQSLQRTPGTDTWTGPMADTFNAANTGDGGATPPDGGTPTAGPACDAPTVTVGSVQGSTDTSPVAGSTVTVAGTVVGDLQVGGFNGVFVQDAGDADPATSDGVFAYGAAGDLALGDRVVVTGTVTEYNGLTELTETRVTECGTEALPSPAVLPLPSTNAEREALEGMYVAPAGTLTVTEVYELNRYGQVQLAQGGRTVTPTEEAEPGPAAIALQASNAARSILLDDGRTTNLSTAGEAPPYLTIDDPVRVGDTATLQPQVLTYSFGEFVLEPADGTAEGNTFPATNPRPAAPAAVGGDLRIGDFNVLNYFVDFPAQFGDSARGADDAAELAQQQAKIVNALATMDADVLTLHEIENSAVLTPDTPYRAVETLIAALEARTGHDWDYVRAHEDTDVITNAIIFRTDRVQTVGAPMIPTSAEATEAFANARTPIAQTFRAGAETFSVIANHLKSKGSGTGANADTGDGQGASNPDRVRQANVLVAFAAEVAATSGDADVLLTGDFNAYRQEDPLDVVRAAGYQEVFTPGEYSYVFDGGSGSLDHVFATPSIYPKITGHTIWDINAVESYAYEYDGYEPLYADYPYRASDHNPTLIGLATAAPVAPDVPATATISAGTPFRGDKVTVTGTGFTAGAKVTATLPQRGGQVLGSGTADADGTVTIRFTTPVLLPQGDHTVALTAADGEQATTAFHLRSVVEEVFARLVSFFRGR